MVDEQEHGLEEHSDFEELVSESKKLIFDQEEFAIGFIRAPATLPPTMVLQTLIKVTDSNVQRDSKF